MGTPHVCEDMWSFLFSINVTTMDEKNVYLVTRLDDLSDEELREMYEDWQADEFINEQKESSYFEP